MKLVEIDELQGGEILAKQILTNDYQVLLGKGTVIKKDYIEKLKELDILSVYVEETVANITLDENEMIHEEVKKDCLIKVRSILEKHMYKMDDDLKKIEEASNEIMMNILNDEHVIKKVYEIKMRSSDVYEHSISVCILSILTSLKLDIPKDEIYDIGLAALMHDLGLRYITVNYDNTNIENYTEKEKEEYKKHTIYGYSALLKEDWISEKVKKLILFHHERMDGSGYPLHAKELTKDNQILALCELFDELLCGVGCVRMKVHEAVEYIKVQKNQGFDATIVDALLQLAAVYPTGTKVKLSDGTIGIVIGQNQGFPERPKVKVYKNDLDKEGNILNLLEILNLVVVDVLD